MSASDRLLSSAPSEPRYDVFLSHSSVDKPVIEAIAERLRKEGYRPFLDKWHLVPGKAWQTELSDALDQSACVAVFFGPKGQGPWHSEEMQVALNRAVRSRDDYRIIPVLLPGSEPSQVSGFLGNRTWVDFRPGVDDAVAYARLVAGIKGVAPETADFELPDEPRPYRGLDRFESDHHEFYFGRDSEVRRLIEHLRQDRFVAVVGASGSGKSSLARAGLHTDQAERVEPGIRGWRRITVVPGHDPLRAVADQVRQVADQLGASREPRDPVEWVDKQVERMRSRHDGLITLLSTLFDDQSSPVLLLVDQFEELFTHRPQAAEGREEWRKRTTCFAANLLAAVAAEKEWLRVVVTVRADFVDDFVSEGFLDLRQLLERRQFWLSAMNESDLREAIVLPARHRGAFFEKGLVEMILRDMRGQITALPLLEEALGDLWIERRGPWLTLNAYEKSGGVGGALATKADSVYNGLSPEDQILARRILLGLIQLGEGSRDSRRRVAVSSLVAAADDRHHVEAVLDRFASTRGSRLITLSSANGTETAEVTHEALIHHWDKLRHWVEGSREDLRLQRRLDEAAQHWDEQNRPAGSLWRPPDLDLLRAFASRAGNIFTRLQLDFYECSCRTEQERAAENERQRQRELESAKQLAEAQTRTQEQAKVAKQLRKRAWLAGAFAVVVLVLAIVAGGLWREAETAQEKAEEYANRLLTDQINRYETIPTVLSAIITPSLADGYPFTDKPWAESARGEIVKLLDAWHRVGTAEVIENWKNVRDELDGWDPATPGQHVPSEKLQNAARSLARSFKRMWDEDRKAEEATLGTIEDSPAFKEKRRSAYAKDLKALESLVSAKRLDESLAARENYRAFWRLYWGELLIVEDPEVLSMMIDVGLRLDSWQTTGEKPADFHDTARPLIDYLRRFLLNAPS